VEDSSGPAAAARGCWRRRRRKVMPRAAALKKVAAAWAMEAMALLLPSLLLQKLEAPGRQCQRAAR